MMALAIRFERLIADRIFAESIRNMSNHFILDIIISIEWINQTAVAGLRNGIHRQIAAKQILFY